MSGSHRSVRNTLALAGLLAQLAGAGLSAQPAGTSIFESVDQLWVAGDVQVPAVADTFALMRVTRYPVVELGVGLTYSGRRQPE